MNKLSILDIQNYWKIKPYNITINTIIKCMVTIESYGVDENVPIRLKTLVYDYFADHPEYVLLNKKTHEDIKQLLIELGLKESEEDLELLNDTYCKLQKQLGLKDKEINKLKKENSILETRQSLELISLINENKELKAKLNPLQDAVNHLTAENSSNLRKIKRLQNKLS